MKLSVIVEVRNDDEPDYRDARSKQQLSLISDKVDAQSIAKVVADLTISAIKHAEMPKPVEVPAMSEEDPLPMMPPETF